MNDSFSSRSRPPYLPPHLRSNDHPSRGGGGAGGGARRGGGGGGRSWGRAPHVRSNSQSGHYFGTNTQSGQYFGTNVNQSGQYFGENVEEESVEGNMDVYDETEVKATGENVPMPVGGFGEMEFPESLRENIRRCKYVKPTPIQRYAIPVAMEGRDLMACAQTGSGKTAAFCFPIISLILMNRQEEEEEEDFSGIAFPRALILSPTRELSCQVVPTTSAL